MIYLFLLSIIILIMFKASLEDIKKRKVSNKYYFCIIALSVLFKIFLGWKVIALMLLSALIFWIIGELLFYSGVIGPGDLKLLFALSFAFGLDFSKLFIFVYLISILVLGIIYHELMRMRGVKNPPLVPLMMLCLISGVMFL